VDAIMRRLQGSAEKAPIMRFGALPMRMGVAGIWILPSRLGESRNERSNAGDQSVANVVEFYIPTTFRKRMEVDAAAAAREADRVLSVREEIRLKDPLL
jgi:hypothetical protein